MYNPNRRKRNGIVFSLSSKNDDDDEDDDPSPPVSKSSKITRTDNHIYYHAEVSRSTVFELIEYIKKCEIDNIVLEHTMNIDKIPIYIHINSFGGTIFDALTAIDVIEGCKSPVHTIIEGATASAGTLISVVGEKRYIRPNAHMLIHQLSSGFWGKMNEIEDDFKNDQTLMKKITDIYKKHASIPKGKMREILKHDLWWTAETCMEYGLVDEYWELS